MDLTQLYGPGFAGYLQGADAVRQRDMQGLRGMGMLSNMQGQKIEQDAMQARLAEKQRMIQEGMAQQQRIQGLLNQPDDVIQGSLGMPAAQVRALYTMGGPGALSAVLKKNAELTPDMKMIGTLDPAQQPAARQAKAGIAPQFKTLDQGGSTAMLTYDPVTLQPRVIGQMDKTAAPGTIPFDMTGLTPEQARQYAIGKASAGAAKIDARERDRRFEYSNKLRDDFKADPRVKAADEMNAAFKLIETAKMRPSPANDLAMATKYMKILDPTSVVRESELAMAMNASGLFDRMSNYVQMVMNGNKLTPKQREDFYTSAKAINESFQGGVSQIADQYREAAKRYDIDPQDVTLGRNVTVPPPATSNTFDQLPSPSMYKGRRMKSDDGTIYRSDGMRWVKE